MFQLLTKPTRLEVHRVLLYRTLTSTSRQTTNQSGKAYKKAIRPLIRDLVLRVHPDVLVHDSETCRLQNEQSLKDLFMLVESTSAKKHSSSNSDKLPPTVRLHFYSKDSNDETVISAKETIRIPTFLHANQNGTHSTKSSDASLRWELSLLNSLKKLYKKVLGRPAEVPVLEQHEQAALRESRKSKVSSTRRKRYEERQLRKQDRKAKQKVQREHPGISKAQEGMKHQVEASRLDRMAWYNHVASIRGSGQGLDEYGFQLDTDRDGDADIFIEQLINGNRLVPVCSEVQVSAAQRLVDALRTPMFRKLCRRYTTEKLLSRVVFKIVSDTSRKGASYTLDVDATPAEIGIPVNFNVERLAEHFRNCGVILKSKT